jgi:uncharacterized protein (DUF58 family)
MRRAMALLLVFLVLSSLAAYTARALLFNLAYVVGLTLTLSFIWALSNILWVRIDRDTVTRRTQVGEHVEERFVVRNTGLLPKLWLEVRDQSELPGHRAGQVLSGIPPRHERGWVTRTLCRKRGRYRLGPISLAAGDPFGLFRFRRRFPEIRHLVVLPATFELPRLQIPAGRLTGGDALHRRTHYVTPSAAGIRDYVPGDSYNRIHWPSTARRGRLIVKEFELDPAADVWIVLDLQSDVHAEAPEFGLAVNGEPAILHLGEPTLHIVPTTEEYTVTVAASLAQHFLGRNRSVGLVAYGQHREVVQADRGLRQLTRLLECLAVLRAEGSVALHEILATEYTQFGRGTTVMVVTPSPDERWVEALRPLRDRGVRPAAVVIDPASFDARYAGARVPPANLLAAGLPTFVVRQGDDLSEVLCYSRKRDHGNSRA